MTTLTITVPDDLSEELSIVAAQLKQTPEQCVLLALNQFLQTETVENAIEGLSRKDDNATLVDFPELKEELGLEIRFHPEAMEELESVEEEDQIEILEHLINHISSGEEDMESTLDLILREEGDSQIVLSGFSFGDIVYQLGKNVVIYLIALSEEEEEEEDDDEDDLDEEEDDEEVSEMNNVKI